MVTLFKIIRNNMEIENQKKRKKIIKNKIEAHKE